jgi:hypothetical protein
MAMIKATGKRCCSILSAGLAFASASFGGEARTSDGQAIAAYNSSPSYIILGDVNSGDGLASELKFRTNGTDRMFLNYYSGISRLDHHGEYAIHGQTVLQFNSGTFSVGDIHGGDGQIQNLSLRTADQPRLWINQSGQVGVGITDPVYDLDIKTGGTLNLRGSTGRIYVNNIRPNTGRVIQLGLDQSPSVTEEQFRLNVDGYVSVKGQAALQYYAAGQALMIGDIMNGDGPVPNLILRTNDQDRVWIDGNGNMGVGAPSSGSKFQVSGGLFTAKARAVIEGNTQGQEALVVDQRVPGVLAQFRRDGVAKVTIAENGDINTTGAISVASVTTKTWTVAPDYVFEKGYKLASLDEVDSFVRKNKHLPEVPSAKEFKEKGMDLAEMNFLLLKKVEELTLHAIRQEKEMKRQAEEIASLKRLPRK